MVHLFQNYKLARAALLQELVSCYLRLRRVLFFCVSSYVRQHFTSLNFWVIAGHTSDHDKGHKASVVLVWYVVYACVYEERESVTGAEARTAALPPPFLPN